MLSKMNTILLGLIAQEPLNPYEIQHILNKINIRDWFPIADSSVYAGIRSLHNKGWILGEQHKDGNMPEKTVYRITEEGSEVLINALIQYLSSLELDLAAFFIGIYFMCLLSEDEVKIIFNIKLKSLEGEMLLLKNQLDDVEIPFIAQTLIRHRFYLMYSEMRTIREILEKMEQESIWNARLTMDWYDRIKDIPLLQQVKQKKSAVPAADDENPDFIS